MNLLEDKIKSIISYLESKDLSEEDQQIVDVNLTFIKIPTFQVSALRNLLTVGLGLEGKSVEFIKRYLDEDMYKV